MTPVARILRESLAARLAMAFLGLSVTVVLVATTVSYRSAETALRERMISRLAAIADADAADIDFWVMRQRAAVEFVARHPAVQRAAVAPAGRTDAEALFRSVPGDVIAATEFRLLGVPGGRVLASNDSASVGAYATEEPYFTAGRDSSFTQRIHESVGQGRPALMVSTPVRDAAGVTRAVLAASLDLADLEAVLLDQEGEVPIDVYLVDRFAQFVSAERFGRAGYRRGVHSLGIDSALTGTAGDGTYIDYSGRPVVGVWRWIPSQQLALLVESPQDAAFAPARVLLARTFLLGSLATALLTFGVVTIARRATRGVLAIANAAERVTEGDFSQRAPVTSEDEVGRLALRFNAMTARLRELVDELNDQVNTTRNALREAEASRSLLRDLADNTTALVAVMDLEGLVRLANARFERLLSLERGTMIGEPLGELLPADVAARLLPAVQAARDGAGTATVELTFTTDAESHVWQATAVPLRTREGTPYAIGVLATDLTERARAEEERREREATVQQAQRLESLGIMAGGIAHDFNNILAAVLGNADLALQALDRPDEVRRSLEQIASAARRASDLTRQMLAYAGKASFRREVVDVRAIITDLVALVRAAQPKKVAFVVDTPPRALPVEIDPAQLSQVVLNLLTNAAEAIGDRVGTVTVRARESLRPATASAGGPARWVAIIVEDDGEGMSAAVQQRIFDPFFSTKRSGRGLGLSAVSGIIRSAGGVLDLRSAPGRGSTFEIFLPASDLPALRAPRDEARDGGTRRATALVIDDEEALRRVCRRALEGHGLTVLDAPDGIEGLARYRAHRDEIDVVVLDLTMPGLGGAEVLAQLRAERPELPVVIASGYAKVEGTAAADDARVRYLQKPFDLKQLFQVVDDLLQ